MGTVPANRPARRRLAHPVPVTINGVAIASADIARETQHHSSSDPDESWALAARALAIRALLSLEAERLGTVAEPIEDEEGRRETANEARLRALLEREVVVPRAGEAECRRFYEQNRKRFRSPDLCEAAHVLVPHGAEARALAESLVADLRQHPERFAEAASVHSACPSSKQGGNLGQLSPGQTIPEFETALADLKVGQLQIVETRYGLHVVRLDRRIDGRDLPFELVRERIAQYLEEAVRRRALKQYVSILASRAKVTGVDLAAAGGPLVQ